jgi:hypothetical protein
MNQKNWMSEFKRSETGDLIEITVLWGMAISGKFEIQCRSFGNCFYVLCWVFLVLEEGEWDLEVV